MASTKSTKRRGARWTADERQFIKSAYQRFGTVEIAKKLGRSRSGVSKLVKEMKESGEIPSARSMERSTGRVTAGPPSDAPDGTQDTAGQLRWVRDILERNLWDAEPPQAARLAKEYRETVMAIEGMEGGSDGGSALAGALSELNRRLGQAPPA